MFVLGEMHLVPFKQGSLIAILTISGLINSFYVIKQKKLHFLKNWKLYILEEYIFLAGLLFWGYIRGLQPDIHGLEKFMDFGFINSILRSNYFPATDMWYPPSAINYYYFGHLVTAVLTKLSEISSNITFNLMLATIFSFTFVCAFSLVMNLLTNLEITLSFFSKVKVFTYALLGGYILTFAGNLHIIYAFFKPYNPDTPVPFWQLVFSPSTFPNSYWYPNATRFIYHTIHEFPMYSFVVSDLHGHVLDIPFVLFTLGYILTLIVAKREKNQNITFFQSLFLGFLLAVMYMTNAWDGIIYLLLGLGLFTILTLRTKHTPIVKRLTDLDFIQAIVSLVASFLLFSLPFSLFFKPFASQIGILCAPSFLTKIGHLGPLLFEPNHCQHSPVYQLLILHGFFLFWIAGFIGFCIKMRKQLKTSDIFVLLLSGLSVLLIIIPEFVYLKDIYPEHYRANTMFKLVYQAFIMLSISTAYTMARLAMTPNFTGNKILTFLYKIIGLILFVFVAIYPYFAINGYYGLPEKYSGLDGTKYIEKQYPSDYAALQWIQKNIANQPVILEAQGDSYTDYERISTNTGLPTVMGWTVHEWLWRGSYDTVSPRIADVQTIFTTKNSEEAKSLLQQYHVSYVIIGSLEREKYHQLQESNFQKLGTAVYRKGDITIYHMLF